MEFIDKITSLKQHEIWQTKGLIIGFFGILAVLGAIHTFFENKIITFILLILLTIIWLSIWFLKNNIKKIQKGKLGILICIHSEDLLVDKRIREDFISSLENSLKENDVGNFTVIRVIPYHIALRFKNANEALSLLKRTRAEYLLYGKVRKRGDKYVLDLMANVRHAKLTEESTERLKKDITSAWVNRFNIEKAESNIELFELTSDVISLCSKYIIALASFASKQFTNAEILFVKIRDAIKNREFPEIPAVRNVRINTTRKLNIIYILQMQECMRVWGETGNIANIEIIKQILNKIFGVYKKDGEVLTHYAIVSVILNEDIRNAIKYMMLINKKARSVIWHLNMGFLAACTDNESEVIYHYDQAWMIDSEALIHINLSKIAEYENFITWFIENKTKHSLLYFLLGILNEKFKGDIEQAKNDFKQFLASNKIGKNQQSVSIAMKFMEIEK